MTTAEALSPETEARIRAIRWRRFTADQAVEIARRWEGGDDAKAIGASISVSHNSIGMAIGQMKQAGVTLRTAHPSKPRP